MNFRGILAFIAAFVAFVAVSFSAPTPETGIALPGSGETALSWLDRLIEPLPIVGPLAKAIGISQPKKQQPPPKKPQPKPQRKPKPRPSKPQRKPQPQRKPAAGSPNSRARPQTGAPQPQRRPGGMPQQGGRPAASPSNPLGLSPAALSGLKGLGMFH
ncbi:hypothetical protein EV175_004491 [Coemansia sp. RSA 1933]|nr:hypothetical protein EV175_004491 [Coemansia sp. RSA 1933]